MVDIFLSIDAGRSFFRKTLDCIFDLHTIFRGEIWTDKVSGAIEAMCTMDANTLTGIVLQEFIDDRGEPVQKSYVRHLKPASRDGKFGIFDITFTQISRIVISIRVGQIDPDSDTILAISG